MKDVPSQAAKYPTGYITVGSSTGVNIQFFAADDFDPNLLTYAAANGQAAAPGEILTVGAGTGVVNAFKGHLLIVTGSRCFHPPACFKSLLTSVTADEDVPFCGGNCSDTTTIQGKFPDLISFSKSFFPHASSFKASVIPGGGHGLNLGYSHKLAYNSIFDFLKSSL